QYLTLTNTNALSVILRNNNGGATGAKIITGTGSDITLAQGASANLIYDNAGGVWRVVGSTGSTGGNYIQNQNAVVQTANYKISGSGEADTSLLSPIVDALPSGTLSLGTGNATGVTIGGTSNTTAVSLQGAVAATYDIGTSTGTGTITLGKSTAGENINIGHAQVANGNTQNISIGDSATGTGKDVITIGNTNGASAVTINAGTGGLSLGGNITASGTYNSNTFSSSALTFGNAGAASVDAASGQNLNLGTGASAHTTTLGSTNGTATTTVQSGSGGINLNGATSVGGSLTVSGSNTFTSGTGNVALNGNTTVGNGVSLATTSATFTTAGVSTSAALNVASYYIMNTSGAAQDIQGITAGRDGQYLTLTNTN